MTNAIRTMPARTKNTIFAVIFSICLLLAVFPPFYLAASGTTAAILGLPVPILYWVFDYALLTLTLWALWRVENIRGEVGYEDAVTSPEGDQHVR
jgi:hypothetical protein